ncbi:uncharacterized protein LOC128549012 [Mercenaria mercenaria]|uniref:uncharacterized protein LOC128549012 n=1 Tax=Mercenaria mercenaria TaxID=6596 RepID=UPI00234F75D9|nr:uncharacterized protein LOC128549012 [Mercenaria mercenaria]
MDITTAYSVLYFIININSLNGQDTFISQEKHNYKSTETCDIQKLESETSLDVQRCSKGADGSQVCLVSDGGSIYEYKCVEESWKLSTGTDIDSHGRQKRFIDWIVRTIVGLFVRAVVFIYCSASGACSEREVNQEEVYRNPPVYTFCPESGAEYTALSQKKSANVTWDEPKAEDDEEVVRETQTFYSGDEFEGTPNGLKHTVTYTAIDGFDLKDTCSFSFTVKYITCDTRDPPIYGHQTCSHGYIFGSECIAECYDGYEIVGNDTATCQQDKTWDNTPA